MLVFTFLIFTVTHMLFFDLMCLMLLINIPIWGNKRLNVKLLISFANHILWKMLPLAVFASLTTTPYDIFRLAWVFLLATAVKAVQLSVLKLILGREYKIKADVWKMKVDKDDAFREF